MYHSKGPNRSHNIFIQFRGCVEALVPGQPEASVEALNRLLCGLSLVGSLKALDGLVNARNLRAKRPRLAFRGEMLRDQGLAVPSPLLLRLVEEGRDLLELLVVEVAAAVQLLEAFVAEVDLAHFFVDAGWLWMLDGMLYQSKQALYTLFLKI